MLVASHTIDAIGVREPATVLGAIGHVWGTVLGITVPVAGLLGAGLPGLPKLVVVVLGRPVDGGVVGAITAVVSNAPTSLVGGVRLNRS